MKRLYCRLRSGAALGLIAALGALVAGPVGATSLQLDLATMTEQAGKIVTGRIIYLRAGSHPKYHNIGALYVTVKVNEVIKGAPAKTLTFMQFSGLMPTTGGSKGLSVARPLPDLPAYRLGEELVLFLYPGSRAGFTSPVGGLQGKFRVQRQEGLAVTVASEAGNRTLAVAGPLPSRLTAAQRRMLRQPGEAMELETFRAVVKQLSNRK